MNITAVSVTSGTNPSSPATHPRVGSETEGLGAGLQADGNTYDPDMIAVTTVEKSVKEQEESDYRTSLYHRDIPFMQASSALDSIRSELGKMNKSIIHERPELARVSWDFTIKDGKLAATGSGLSDDDRKWLTDRLNQSGILTAAANTFINAAGDYLDTTDENPSYHAINYYTGSAQSYEFHDVQKQLEGHIGFKELIGSVKAMYENPGGSPVTGYDSGYASLELMASRLTSGTRTGDIA